MSLTLAEKPGEISGKIGHDVGGPLDQFVKGIFGGVVETLAGGFRQQGVAGLLGGRLVFLRRLAHRLPGGLQHAVQTAQQGEGQDHVFVILGVVVVLDQVGDFPEELAISEWFCMVSYE